MNIKQNLLIPNTEENSEILDKLNEKKYWFFDNGIFRSKLGGNKENIISKKQIKNQNEISLLSKIRNNYIKKYFKTIDNTIISQYLIESSH